MGARRTKGLKGSRPRKKVRNSWQQGPETTENEKRNPKRGLYSGDSIGGDTFPKRFMWVPVLRSGTETHKLFLGAAIPALLQKLVGELFLIFAGKSGGKFGGNFVGFFLSHRTEAQKFRGKYRSSFRKKIRSSIKIFRAKFTLQTCHLNFLGAANGGLLGGAKKYIC